MGADEIIVAGGAEIYAALLPRASRIDFTRVRARIDGDVVFPELDPSIWREASREECPRQPGDDHAYAVISFERKS